jgi:hypothetical protein
VDVQVGAILRAMLGDQPLQQEHAAAFGVPPLFFEIIGIALRSVAEAAHARAAPIVRRVSLVHFGLHGWSTGKATSKLFVLNGVWVMRAASTVRLIKSRPVE